MDVRGRAESRVDLKPSRAAQSNSISLAIGVKSVGRHPREPRYSGAPKARSDRPRVGRGRVWTATHGAVQGCKLECAGLGGGG